MIGEKNEKSLFFFKVCAISIIYIVIGLFSFFAFCVIKVNAAEYTNLNPNSINTDLKNSSGNITTSATCNWNDLPTCNLSLNTSSNQRYTMKFNASYYASASNSISVNYVVGYYMNFSAINQNVNISPNDVSVYYYSSGEQISVSNKCTTTGTKYDGTPQTGKHLVYYIFNTTCENINPGKNASQIVITTPLPTSISNIYNVYGRIASYSLTRITGTITDSDKIISNQNQNTQWVINNINTNTTEIISNQNENTEIINNSIQQTNDELENINESILDESPADTDLLDGIYVSNDEPISQLILLPINMARAFLNALDGQCRDYSFGSLYGHNLKLTCVNIQNYLGSNLYHYIDLFMSFFMIYEIFMLIIKAFNDITSLRDGFDDLYVPKHEGYKTKHNGERV